MASQEFPALPKWVTVENGPGEFDLAISVMRRQTVRFTVQSEDGGNFALFECRLVFLKGGSPES